MSRIIIYEEETGNTEEFEANITREKLFDTLDSFRNSINFKSTIENLKEIKENEDSNFVYWINVSNVLGSAIILVYTAEEFSKIYEHKDYLEFKMFCASDLVMKAQKEAVVRKNSLGIQFLRGVMWAEKELNKHE